MSASNPSPSIRGGKTGGQASWFTFKKNALWVLLLIIGIIIMTSWAINRLFFSQTVPTYSGSSPTGNTQGRPTVQTLPAPKVSLGSIKVKAGEIKWFKLKSGQIVHAYPAFPSGRVVGWTIWSGTTFPGNPAYNRGPGTANPVHYINADDGPDKPKFNLSMPLGGWVGYSYDAVPGGDSEICFLYADVPAGATLSLSDEEWYPMAAKTVETGKPIELN